MIRIPHILLLAALAGASLLGPLSRDAAGEPSLRYPLEREDDPPGSPAKALPGASIASTIYFGRFASVQVNVTQAGADLVGDAANEPSIAVDPTNHDHMVIGWRQFDTISSNFRQAGVGYTTDGGQTWTAGKIEAGIFRSDPVLGVSSSGEFFYNSLRGNLTSQVFPSVDGGASWAASAYAYGGDKQWMVVDRTGGASDGFIHQAWSTFATSTPEIYNRSVDGGESFSEPSSLGGLFGGTLDVAADGTLYVVGTDGAYNYVARSLDARDRGVTPTFDYFIVDLGGVLAVQDPNSPNPAGLTGQLWISVDRSNGPHAGWIYVLASVPTASDPMDVMFARSTDGGETWSAPVRVNDDPGKAWQWFGTMSLAPDGRIEAVWNDSRVTGDSTRTALFYAYSIDGGQTWTASQQVSPVWNSRIGWPNQQKIGDYYHMVSDDQGADLAWSATFSGGQDVYYTRITRAELLAVEEGPRREPELHAAAPNPFRVSTSLRFDVPASGARVKLRVFDLAGRVVSTLADGWLPGGAHVAAWNGGGDTREAGVAPGVYLCRLEVGGVTRTRRIVRLR